MFRVCEINALVFDGALIDCDRASIKLLPSFHLRLMSLDVNVTEASNYEFAKQKDTEKFGLFLHKT